MSETENLAMYCSEPPGCICRKCLFHESGRCPYGSCYDDLRAKENPYDKAHPDKPPRTSWSKWNEEGEQAHWCRGGIFYQTQKCPSHEEYDKSKHIVRECFESITSTFQDGYISCSLVESVGCEECMRRAKERRKRKKEETMTTYFTKCGKEFNKPGNAVVTGYHLQEDRGGSLFDSKCIACPFRTEVMEGYPEQHHKRWECRAGSEPPNPETTWRGNLNDKNTLNIYSLDHELMEQIREFAQSHPDLSGAYNADSQADCRRTLSISCSANKKGMAAKQEPIDKFFPDQDATPDIEIEAEYCFAQDDKGLITEMKEAICGYCGNHLPTGPDIGKCELTQEPVSYYRPACGDFIGKDDEVDEDELRFMDLEDQLDVLLDKADKFIEKVENGRCCGSCNVGHWYSGKNTYVSVVQSDGITTIKRPCEPQTHYCTDFIDDRKKIATDADFNPETSPEWCPMNTTTETPKPEIREDGTLALSGGFEIEILKSCATCGANKDSCDSYQNGVRNEGLSPEDMGCEDWIVWGKSEPGEPEEPKPEESAMPKNHRSCGNCTHHSGSDKANYHCAQLNAYKNQYGAPIPAAQACDEFRNKWDEPAVPDVVKPVEIEQAPAFDYSELDSETVSALRMIEGEITRIKMQTVYDIGSYLKIANDALAKTGHGTFGAWCESIGFSRASALNYIQAYEFIRINFSKPEDAIGIQPSLLFAASKPSAPPELQQAVVDGDITKHKDYQEALKKLKRAEEAVAAQQTIERDYRKRLEEVEQQHEESVKSYQEESRRVQELVNDQVDRNRKIFDLEKEIDQLKQSSDPAKLAELESEIAELREQLSAKPIEVPAVEIREVASEELETAWAHSIESAMKLIARLKSDDIQRIIKIESKKNPAYLEAGYSELVDDAYQNIGILSRYLRRK